MRDHDIPVPDSRRGSAAAPRQDQQEPGLPGITPHSTKIRVPVEVLRALQRKVGNAAVSDMLNRRHRPRTQPVVQRAQPSVKEFTAEPDERPLWSMQSSRQVTVGLGYGAGINFTAEVSSDSTDEGDPWTVGFIQTMSSSSREALYDPTRGPGDARLSQRPQIPTPVRDGMDSPWYKAEGTHQFDKPEDATITATDEPRFDALLETEADLGDGAGLQALGLIGTTGQDRFTTWVAARQGSAEPIPLRQVEWSVDFGASVAQTQQSTEVTPQDGSGLTTQMAGAAPAQRPRWVLGGRSANEIAWDAETTRTVVQGPGRPAQAELPNPYATSTEVEITTMADLSWATSVARAEAGQWDEYPLAAKGECGRVVSEADGGLLVCLGPDFYVLVPEGAYGPPKQ